MVLRIKYATLILVFFNVLAIPTTFGQCPDGSDLSNNDHCFVVHWMEIPDPLPSELFHNGAVFTYQNGTGSMTDPAVYQSGGGSGACNANQDPFTGTIIVDGMECTYMDGNLEPPLPIELLEFKAAMFNSEVRLAWTTTQEAANKGFDVQKSTNGKTWSRLIWINGAGNSNAFVEYSAVDYLPFAGTNYYRLCQYDLDGGFNYSPIVTITTKNRTEGLKAYPNPASSTLYVEGNNNSAITIMNLEGVILIQHLPDNDNSIDISMLPQGVYFMRNSSTGEPLKFVKY